VGSIDIAFLSPPDRDTIVARLSYATPGKDDWASAYIPLDQSNSSFSDYDTLTFFAKGDSPQGTPITLKLELKRLDNPRVGVYAVTGLGSEWKQYVVPLSAFGRVDRVPALCGWEEMTELAFVFRGDYSGPSGTVYLDDIHLERRGESATSPGVGRGEMAVDPLVLADFSSGAPETTFGDEIGAAYTLGSPNVLTHTYPFVQDQDHGHVAELRYDIEEWSGFWIQLPEDNDLTPYCTVNFDIRAEQAVSLTKVKLEIKYGDEDDEKACADLSPVTDDWQRAGVELTDFEPELPSWINVRELVFVFEFPNAGKEGIVYLDNITFEP
jgi:hypothetical protein